MNESVHEVVAVIVPHAAIGKGHGEIVLSFEVVSLGVLGGVASAANIATNETNPEVFGGAAHGALVGQGLVRARHLGITANWAGQLGPLLQARSVK